MSCQLCPHDRFISSLITAAVGSVITGITAGWLVAFGTAWISLLATTRIIVVGVWFCYKAIKGDNLEGGESLLRKIPLLKNSKRLQVSEEVMLEATRRDEHEAPPSYDDAVQRHNSRSPSPGASKHLLHGDTDVYASTRSGRLGRRQMRLLDPAEATKVATARQMKGFEKTPPSILGWVGWSYSTLYFPVVQILWLISNWSGENWGGIAKLIRGLSIAVTALPLTIDTKARYAVMLERRYGRWANRLFTYIHAFTTLLLGLVSAIMMCLAIPQASLPIPIIPVYVIFTVIWMLGSFQFFPPLDGGRPPNNLATFLAGLGMGMFGALFVAFPSFVAMMFAPGPNGENGESLGSYLRCEVAVWEKLVAVLP